MQTKLVPLKQIFKIFFALLLLTAPAAEIQARGLVPCGGYADDLGTPEPACKVTDFFVLIARVTNWLIAFAGVYAVYVIVFAGFDMVVSQGEEEKITAKKRQLTNAVVGFVFTMLAFIIINTAVNGIFLRGYGVDKDLVAKDPDYAKCKLDLRDPESYLNIRAEQIAKCRALHEQLRR